MPARTIPFIVATIFIDAIGFGIIMPVLPQLVMEVGKIDLPHAIEIGAWIGLVMAVATFLASPVLGNLSDRFGRRRVLLLSLGGLAADYTLLTMVGTLPWLFVARALSGVFGGSYAAAQAAIAMLDRVRIPDAARRVRQYPHQFSGGMRQRVMIAMALLVRPALLLADEPTTALDVTIQAQVLDLIAELAREAGTAVILVTHDLGVVARLCDRMVVLYGGRIMEEGACETVFAAPAHPYASALLAATPRLTDALTPRLGTIPGTPRSGGAMLPGCPFAPRCTVKIAACETAQPPLRPLVPGHAAACHLIGAAP